VPPRFETSYHTSKPADFRSAARRSTKVKSTRG
jgi:hypothetical protein